MLGIKCVLSFSTTFDANIFHFDRDIRAEMPAYLHVKRLLHYVRI
jgi:hypothetical protein